jgi:transposase
MVWAPPSYHCFARHLGSVRVGDPTANIERGHHGTNEQTVIAVDIAKKVFQLHWVDLDTGCIERLQLKRARMLDWFANRTAALVVMEACGGAHDWARALIKFGHEVRLISPRKVRPSSQQQTCVASPRAQSELFAC